MSASVRFIRRLSVRALTTKRSRRIAAMCSLAIAWAVAVVGVATGTVWVASVGLILTGGVSLVLAKLTIETTTRLTKLTASTPKVATPHREPVAAAVAADLAGVKRNVEHQRVEATSGISDARQGLRELQKRFEELERRVRATEQNGRDVVDSVAAVEPSLAAVELAVADSRKLLDKVARHVVEARRPADIEELGRARVEHPTLSIAIPVYNRSDVFAECLASIEENLAEVPAGSVEVCITDDASSDPDTVAIAADFVRRAGAASLHLNAVNLGLEGNLLRSSSYCRGTYLLVLGSDDRLMKGALPTILADLQDGRAGVLVYDQSRITLDGRPSQRVEGSAPLDVPAGSTHEFSSLSDGIRRCGLISTIGFTSNVVFRRAEFEAVRTEPYFGLTVYPLAFIIAEAHARAPMRYTNVAVVEHRTPLRFEKHAEGIGSIEVDFMRGGDARAARHFGTTLAASYQRLIDSGAFEARSVAELPERLLTAAPLVEWIARNRTIAPELDGTFGAGVVADAERFFAGSAPDPVV